MSQTTLELPTRYQRQAGRLYKTPAGGVALDVVSENGHSVDAGKMSAKAIICTTRVDRHGEVIVPMGVTFEDYKKNPVVLWDHGFDCNISVPIAKSEREDGSLAVDVYESQF